MKPCARVLVKMKLLYLAEGLGRVGARLRRAASLFPELRFSPVLKDRVLIEIISPSGTSTWKHRLCYRESLWSAFWSRAWGRLLKPRSI